MITSEIRATSPSLGNGTWTDINFTFKVFADSDIKLVKTDTDGAEAILVLGVDYTVALNANQDVSPGGTITLTAPSITDHTYVGTSTVPYLQLTKITNLGGFYPDRLNTVFDRITILIQQVLEPLNRSIRIPISDGMAALELPTKTLRANKALVFDANGNPGVSIGDYSDPAQYAQQAQEYAQNAADSAADTAADVITTGSNVTAAQAAQSAAEAAAAGIKWRASVRAATTTTLPACTYANGASGVGATLTGNANGALAAQDGITLGLNEDLLVQNQAAPAQNGVYRLTQVGSGGAPFILTRRTDADTWAELVSQAVTVDEGTTNADYSFICTVNAGGTVGVTSVTWTNAFSAIRDGGVSTAAKVVDGILTHQKLNSSVTAAQSDMESASANDKFVTPGRAKYHPGVAKAWAYVTYSAGVPTLAANTGVASITDLGVGYLRITFSAAFSSVNYAVNVSADSAAAVMLPQVDNRTTTYVDVYNRAYSTGNPADPTAMNIVCFGDQ